MNTQNKEHYLEPQLETIDFTTEKGFATSQQGSSPWQEL